MPKLVYIVTHPMTAFTLLRGQLAYMQEHGFETYLITSPGKGLTEFAEQQGIRFFPLPMEREISLLKDVRALFRLCRVLRKLKPAVVNAGTPKAGFLGMVAASISGVPRRIYTLRGLRLETKQGFARWILSATERIASSCADRVICVSESLKIRYLSLGLARASKLVVLGSGSSNGVDIERFRRSAASDRDNVRRGLSIPADAKVIGFIGRFTVDKGFMEALQVFDRIREQDGNVYLLAVGEFEKGDPIPDEIIAKFRRTPNVVHPGFVEDPSRYYSAMDVLLFPSHREGFPNAPLEAAAAAIPTVGFAVTGTVDAIEDHRTGRLVAPFDIATLAAAVTLYLENDELRFVHGKAACERVMQHFKQEFVWEKLREIY